MKTEHEQTLKAMLAVGVLESLARRDSTSLDETHRWNTLQRVAVVTEELFAALFPKESA